MKRMRDFGLLGPGFWLGGSLLMLLVTVALFAPLIAPGDPLRTVYDPFATRSFDHPLGTDHIGRDLFSMMIWGTRVSLLFAFGAAGISLLIGVILGGVSGYFGGIVDDVLSRLFEVFIIIPRLFLIIVIVAMFGANLWLVVLVIGSTLWPSNARVMRAQVLSLKGRGFAQAAIVSGASHARVLFEQIMPNGIGPVLANSTLQMAYAVLLEAGLAFLGFGDPDVASWGQILYAGQNYIQTFPSMAIVPGLAISMLLLTLHLVGNGMLRRLNPRTQIVKE